MKVFKPIFAILFVILVSCKNETSLQEYYVNNQSDTNFVALDIPTSLLLGENSALNSEQKTTLETIKKVNLIGYPVTKENKNLLEAEKTELRKILADEKYQTLMKLNYGATKAEFYFLGEDTAIDELIVFGSNEDKGFGVARILGEDMNPEDLIQLFQSVKNGNLQLGGLEELLSKKQ